MSMRPKLPLVDPDYLIQESDPDKLRAYARGLLLQLRNPSRSYSREMVKAATVWLVGAYVDARLPLAPEMAALIAGVQEGAGEECERLLVGHSFRGKKAGGPQRQSTIGGIALCGCETRAGGGWVPAAADAPIEKQGGRGGTGCGPEERGSHHQRLAEIGPLPAKRAPQPRSAFFCQGKEVTSNRPFTS